MGWSSRFFNFFRSEKLSRDISREMSFHLGEREDALVDEGMSRDAARREARRRFGNVSATRESTRESDLIAWLDSLLRDLRYATRALAASRGFTFVAILSLALGIGANTAIFSLIDAVMLKSLPVRDPQELVLVRGQNEGSDYFTNPLWEQIRDGQDVFSGVFAYGGQSFNLSDAGEERPADALWVSGDFFSTLGVQAAVGRTLTRADDVRGCPGTAVISHAFWREAYGSSPTAVGQRLLLNGKPFEIVGVVEPRFFGIEVGSHAKIYTPLCAAALISGNDSFLDKRSWWFLRVIARPKPELALPQLRARFTATSAAFFANTVPPNWAKEHQEEYTLRRLDVDPSLKMISSLRTTYADALTLLMGISGLVLLIACANVANLMLARTTVRQRELAVRVALGAARRRILSQLFTEGLLLSLAGATLGLAFAVWGRQLLVRFLSTSREAVSLDLPLDLRVLGFTLFVATTTALLFALAPAWRAWRIDPQAAMHSRGRSVIEGHSRFGIGKTLVIAQIGLSLVLLAGAGLLVRSFHAMATVDAGFDATNVLVARANLRLPAGDARYTPLRASILERLRAIPGVQSASASFNTPLAGMSWNDLIEVETMTGKSHEEREFFVNEVSDGYFTTLSMQLIAGRDFDSRDKLGAPRVAVVNTTFAERFFPGRSPIGATYRVPQGDSPGPTFTIVGIVRDAKYRSLNEKTPATAFYPIDQDPNYEMGVAFSVKSAAAVEGITAGMTKAITDVVPNATLQFAPLSRQVAETLTRPRLMATLAGFFGGLALLLAVIGLYGIMSYNVARRRREIGVRLALGAEPRRVLTTVLREVGGILAIGLVLGVAGALASSRLLTAFLFGLAPTDAITLGGAVLLLGATALLAGYLPARRASRVDPMRTIRED